MPPRRLYKEELTKDEELDKLRKEVRSLRTANRLRKRDNPKRIVCIPGGRPGRSPLKGGYSLQQAMGFGPPGHGSKLTRRYNRIYQLVKLMACLRPYDHYFVLPADEAADGNKENEESDKKKKKTRITESNKERQERKHNWRLLAEKIVNVLPILKPYEDNWAIISIFKSIQEGLNKRAAKAFKAEMKAWKLHGTNEVKPEMPSLRTANRYILNVQSMHQERKSLIAEGHDPKTLKLTPIDGFDVSGDVLMPSDEEDSDPEDDWTDMSDDKEDGGGKNKRSSLHGNGSASNGQDGLKNTKTSQKPPVLDAANDDLDQPRASGLLLKRKRENIVGSDVEGPPPSVPPKITLKSSSQKRLVPSELAERLREDVQGLSEPALKKKKVDVAYKNRECPLFEECGQVGLEIPSDVVIRGFERHDADPSQRSASQLCKDLNSDLVMHHGLQEGWKPASDVDWKRFKAAVSCLKPEITPLFENEIQVLEALQVVGFVDEMRIRGVRRVIDLEDASEKFMEALTAALCHSGYYGAQGAGIIISTVTGWMGEYADNNVDLEAFVAAMWADLLKIVHTIAQDPDWDAQFWKIPSFFPMNRPLISLERFRNLILVPYISIRIIQADLEIESEYGAAKVWYKSQKFGEIFSSGKEFMQSEELPNRLEDGSAPGGGALGEEDFPEPKVKKRTAKSLKTRGATQGSRTTRSTARGNQ